MNVDVKKLAALGTALVEINKQFAEILESLSDRLVSIEEASRITGLSPRQLRYKVETGTLTAEKEGGRLKFHSSELEALITDASCDADKSIERGRVSYS